MAVYGNRFQTSISISLEENIMFEDIMTSISEMTRIEFVNEAAIGDKIRVIINKIKHLLSELMVKINTKISEIQAKPFREFWAWFSTESTINKVVLTGQLSLEERLYTKENADRLRDFCEKNISSAEYLAKENYDLKHYFSFSSDAQTCKSQLLSLLNSGNVTKEKADQISEEILRITRAHQYSTDDIVKMFNQKQIHTLNSMIIAILSGNYLKDAYELFKNTNRTIDAEKYIKYLTGDGSKSNLQEFDYVFSTLMKTIRNIAYRTIQQYKFCVGFTMLLMNLSGYNKKK